jgi:hypothetical protein
MRSAESKLCLEVSRQQQLYENVSPREVSDEQLDD